MKKIKLFLFICIIVSTLVACTQINNIDYDTPCDPFVSHPIEMSVNMLIKDYSIPDDFVNFIGTW